MAALAGTVSPTMPVDIAALASTAALLSGPSEMHAARVSEVSVTAGVVDGASATLDMLSETDLASACRPQLCTVRSGRRDQLSQQPCFRDRRAAGVGFQVGATFWRAQQPREAWHQLLGSDVARLAGPCLAMHALRTLSLATNRNGASLWSFPGELLAASSPPQSLFY